MRNLTSPGAAWAALGAAAPAAPAAPADASPEPRIDGPAVVHQYLADLRDVVGALDVPSLGRIVERIADSLRAGRTVFLAGNGGSATAAAHMAVDWMNTAVLGGWRTSIVNLAESAGRLTAIGNDHDFAEVFAAQLRAQGCAGDLVVLMSVSGSSPNLVRAAEAARGIGMQTIGLLGYPGELAQHCTLTALVGRGDYGLAEDLHIAVNHMITRALRGGSAQLYRPHEQGVG
jgi:D-sedoheptulose 7-phosphate isomerase